MSKPPSPGVTSALGTIGGQRDAPRALHVGSSVWALSHVGQKTGTSNAAAPPAAGAVWRALQWMLLRVWGPARWKRPAPKWRGCGRFRLCRVLARLILPRSVPHSPACFSSPRPCLLAESGRALAGALIAACNPAAASPVGVALFGVLAKPELHPAPSVPARHQAALLASGALTPRRSLGASWIIATSGHSEGLLPQAAHPAVTAAEGRCSRRPWPCTLPIPEVLAGRK